MAKFTYEELIEEITKEAKSFPKYTTQILNLANQNSQGTRPKMVGQLSELIQECPHKEYVKWKEWYLKKHPDSISKATEKVLSMVENLKNAINKIDRAMVKKWVEDLVIDKTFIGLKFQEAILKRIAQENNKSYRLSNSEEESRGIDGYIGDDAVSIKPMTYKSKNLSESIDVKMIYYEKKKGGIVINASGLD